MPVCTQDRLKVVTTAAAAIFAAAASVSAWAQTADPQTPNSQGATTQPPALRGTDQSSSQAENLPTAQPQTQDSANPIATPPPSYGLPVPVSDTSDVINYGKPKPKKPKLFQLRKQKPIGELPLPPLIAYKTAPGMLKRNSNSPTAETMDPCPTVAVIPTLPHPTPPKPDQTPFDPLGIDVGSLRLFPYVEADTGYDTNPNQQSSNVVGSTYAHGETGLKVELEWSQHSFTAELRGGYYDYFRVPNASRPDVAGTITGRVDVTKQTQINLQSTVILTTQQPGSPLLAIPGSVFITNRPLVATFGQSIGVTQEFNRLSIGLRGTFDRYIFGDATQSDGTMLLLSQDDYDDYGLIGRASYELTPGVIPFIQVTADKRLHDQFLDVYGFARNSDGIAGEFGTTFEFTRLLTGELAAGYANRVYADPRLPNLNAPTVDASLIYTATPLTTFTLRATTDLSETTLAYASGAVSRSVSLEATHALRRDLTLTAIAIYQNNFYEGQPITEQRYSGAIKADYHLTRSVLITSGFTHQRFESTAPGSNYTENIFLVGLKLQD